MELAFLQIGTQEMFVILVAALFLFGGKKLPELARGLGRGIREFKDASEGIKREISDQINNFEKDLDVTNDSQEEKTSQVDQYAATEEPDMIGEASGDVAEEKNFPQFSSPENTFQHDPGAHPVDETEYYKYGYNDHFAADEPTVDASASEGQDANEATKQA